MSACISSMNIKSPRYICKIHLYLYIKEKVSYIIFTSGIKQILNSEAWGLGGWGLASVQFTSVTSNSLRPHGLHHTRVPCPSPILELTQTHVHQVSDAIQPSHPLSSPSPSAFNPPQHQSLCQWVSSWHQVAKVLELQLQDQSFQWIFKTDFL